MQVHDGKLGAMNHRPSFEVASWAHGNASVRSHFLPTFLTAAVLILVAASASSADLLFDNVSRADTFTSRDAGDSPLAAITVSTPTSIDQIGARVDLVGNGDIKFLIFNLNSGMLLFASDSRLYIDDGLNFKVSPVFPAFRLDPGVVYGIGGIANTGGMWSINNTSSGNNFTENGITASDDRNGNVTNFSAPSLTREGAAMIIVQLYGQAVPEPSSLFLLLLGTVAVVGCMRSA